MNAEEREQTEAVLSQRISRDAWNEFLASDEGTEFSRRLKLVRATLEEAELLSPGSQPRPSAEAIDVYGNGLLNNSDVGPFLRQTLLENISSRDWNRLKEKYALVAGSRGEPVHGNMKQAGAGSRVMAEHWQKGGRWAQDFCAIVGLPECLALSERRDLPEDESIWPAEPLAPLHDFQSEVYEMLRALLDDGSGTAMLSLPTGAGKTRTVVDAVCDHLASSDNAKRNVVLWVAQSEELQTQAWECFRQVWQVPPDTTSSERVHRPGPLRLLCAWGSRKPDTLELGRERTIIIAGIQQLHSWVRRDPTILAELFPKDRRAAIIVDEAHRLIAEQHRDVLLALDLRLKHRWQAPQNAALVIGLTATPWRTESSQDESLRSYFQKALLKPDRLGDRPIRELQRRGILSKVTHEPLAIDGTPEMTPKQRVEFETYHELPQDYLKVLGRDVSRNATIIHKLRRLPKSTKALVFACSVEHAELLTLLLNRALGPCAAVVTGKTPRGARASLIKEFRDGKLRYLCNVGVLTTGFDAPKANVVCLTRPTASALLYEQMVGRGLRGPKNGGTEHCLVIDVQDEGLVNDVQSYARVVELWDGTTSTRRTKR